MPVLGQVAGSSLPPGSTLTSLPWHCQQPLTAAALLPLWNAGVIMPRLPSTTSASVLSSEPRMRAPLEWCEWANSSASFDVAAGAVLRRDDRGDPLAFVLEGVRLALLGRVAFVTAHVRPVVLAVAPLLVDRTCSPACGNRRRPCVSCDISGRPHAWRRATGRCDDQTPRADEPW